MNDDVKDGLETFFPAPRSVMAGGMEIPILTLSFMMLGRFSKPLREVMPLLQAGRYREVAEDYPAELCQAMSVATDVEAETLGNLPLDDFLDVVVAVIEANLSFFLGRVVPRLRAIAEKTRPAPDLPPPNPQATPPAGPTSSPDLSEPDLVSATLAD